MSKTNFKFGGKRSKRSKRSRSRPVLVKNARPRQQTSLLAGLIAQILPELLGHNADPLWEEGVARLLLKAVEREARDPDYFRGRSPTEFTVWARRGARWENCNELREQRKCAQFHDDSEFEVADYRLPAGEDAGERARALKLMHGGLRNLSEFEDQCVVPHYFSKTTDIAVGKRLIKDRRSAKAKGLMVCRGRKKAMNKLHRWLSASGVSVVD